MACEHNSEPAWFSAKVLLASSNEPLAFRENLLPKDILTSEAVFWKEFSKIGPEHECALTFKNWDIDGFESSNHRFIGFSQSALKNTDEVIKPFLISKNFAHEVLGVS